MTFYPVVNRIVIPISETPLSMAIENAIRKFKELREYERAESLRVATKRRFRPSFWGDKTIRFPSTIKPDESSPDDGWVYLDLTPKRFFGIADQKLLKTIRERKGK